MYPRNRILCATKQPVSGGTDAGPPRPVGGQRCYLGSPTAPVGARGAAAGAAPAEAPAAGLPQAQATAFRAAVVVLRPVVGAFAWKAKALCARGGA